MSEIDWNTELKKVEREFLGLPPVPSADDLRAKREAERRDRELQRQRHTRIGASVRLMLVVLLAIAINFWPYAHACGTGLFAFLGAGLLLVFGGVWTTVYTWRGRMPKAHAIAMLVIIWGLALAAAQVLPRAGYPSTAAGTPATWMCGAPAP